MQLKIIDIHMIDSNFIHASVKVFLFASSNITQKSCACPIIFCDIKLPLLKVIGDWGQAIKSERWIENAITKLSLGCFGIFMGLEICYHEGELQSLIT